ncbi:hypothetical protein HMPREF0083_06248 [Aneurinibacillus aneurinilyticus ATCC 12856]|uniref:Uncharacterized protein n=1 Tax=Aneurinibacillus aneurinilyticus ATCC 12856 TaxID=649747 RepID=U1W604_ANEAE|nr:hypothetical protein HMPREF0083_06248 [Aneurinibacillus aneurinilyticus ATCC 12856]
MKSVLNRIYSLIILNIGIHLAFFSSIEQISLYFEGRRRRNT